MSLVKKIAKIRKSKLKNLAEIINDAHPNSINERMLNDWKSLSDDRLRIQIETYLLTRQFSEKFLIDVKNELFKFPWKPIFLSVIFIFIIFLSYEFYRYSCLERAYVLESDLKIDFTDGNSKLYSFLETTKKNDSTIIGAPSTLLIKSINRNRFEVQDESFIGWIFGTTKSVFIDSVTFTRNKEIISLYNFVFSDFKGNKNMFLLSLEDRRNIIDFISQNNFLKSATLVGRVSPNYVDNYLPFEKDEYNTNKFYFLCFKTSKGFENIKLIKNITGTYTFLNIASSTIWNDYPLLWKKRSQKQKAEQFPPQVHFLDIGAVGKGNIKYRYAPIDDTLASLEK